MSEAMIDNGDGTYTVRTNSTVGGSALNPKSSHPISDPEEWAKKLFTVSGGNTSMNIT